jgi:hypothetical protein
MSIRVNLSTHVLVIPSVRVDYNKHSYTIAQKTLSQESNSITFEKVRRYVHNDHKHEQVGRKWYNKLYNHVKKHCINIKGAKLIEKEHLETFVDEFNQIAKDAREAYNKDGFSITARIFPIHDENDLIGPMLMDTIEKIKDLTKEVVAFLAIKDQGKKKVMNQKSKVNRILADLKKQNIIFSGNIQESMSHLETYSKQMMTLIENNATMPSTINRFENITESISDQLQTKVDEIKPTFPKLEEE